MCVFVSFGFERMELLFCVLVLVSLVATESKVVHEDFNLIGCSKTEKEFLDGMDGEEFIHADFRRQKQVITLPDFSDTMSWQDYYEAGLAQIQVCLANLDVAIKAYKSPEEKIDKPQTTIYTKNVMEQDVGNVLICHVTGFFPPPVNISWTKNIELVAGDSLSQYRPNDDGTYNIFSSLSFTPDEGDIYTCSVTHRSLDLPQTRTRKVDLKLPAMGPSVFCGLGLSLGLLGVAVGTFFLIKGINCH